MAFGRSYLAMSRSGSDSPSRLHVMSRDTVNTYRDIVSWFDVMLLVPAVLLVVHAAVTALAGTGAPAPAHRRRRPASEVGHRRGGGQPAVQVTVGTGLLPLQLPMKPNLVLAPAARSPL